MPLSLLVEIAVSSLMGCAVGWVTNAVAIDMLFRKYWKWGGVIEERYAEFIENMSQLVEEDLVNSRTLFKEFSSEGFKAALGAWIEDILKKELPARSGNRRLADIPGIEQSVEGLLALADKTQPALLNGIYAAIKSEKIGAFVSEEQYKCLVTRNTQALLANKDHYAGKIQGILAAFLGDKAINILISDKAIHRIAENIKMVIQKADISRYDEKNESFDKLYRELLVSLDIDRIIKDLQDRLSRTQISELVNNPKELAQNLVTQALAFARSPEGQDTLSCIIADFLQDARAIAITLDAVISPALKAEVIRFCEAQTPILINRICAFVQETQSEIEAIVNETIDTQLDSTLGGKIGKFLKDGNLAAGFDVTGKITSALQRYGDTAGTRGAAALISLLETKTLGEIAAYAQDTKNTVPSFLALVNRGLRELENKDGAFVDMPDKQVGEIFGPVNLSIIKTGLLPWVFDRVKWDYLYGHRFKQDMSAGVTGAVAGLAGKTVSEFFDVRAIPIRLNTEKITNRLIGWWPRVSEIKISAVLGENLKIPAIERGTLGNIWLTHRYRELNQLYKAGDKLYAGMADWIIGILNQNLDALLTGNVSSLVNKELSKLEPKEINRLVRDFMGKEMRSINILGAALGLVIGGLSVVAAFIIGAPVDFRWWMLAVYGALFAAVGMGTNWLAIKMLFKPYTALFPGARFPPFIGVAPLRKSEFAQSVGAFVKVRLLGDNALTNFFIANKEEVKHKCSQKLRAENHAALNRFLSGERLDHLNGAIRGAVRSYITRNQDKAADIAASGVARLVHNGANIIPVARDGIVNRLKESDVGPALAGLIKKETAGKPLAAYKNIILGFVDIPLKKHIETSARNLDLTPDKAKALIIEQDHRFISFIESRSLGDVMGNEDALKGQAAAQLGALLHAGFEPIINILRKEELAPHKKLNEVFGGALSRLLKKNSGFILDMASKEAGKARGAIISEIKDGLPFYAAPWKGHVEPVVNTLLDEKLPKFLHEKQDKLEAIIGTALESNLADLGYDDTSLDIPAIEQEAAALFADILLKRLYALPLQTALGIVNIGNVQDLVQALAPLLSTAVERVRDNAAGDEAIGAVLRAAQDMLMSLLERTEAADLLAGMDLETELRDLGAKLARDGAASAEIARVVEDGLRAIEWDSAFYNDRLLRRDMADYIRGLAVGQRWEPIGSAAAPAIQEFLRGIHGALTPETKNAFCNDYLLTAILDSAVYHFPRIIRSIDVQAVVEREVNNMHPSGIEKLFYKFAGNYFKKITFYGWIGLFGGLLSYAIARALGLIPR